MNILKFSQIVEWTEGVVLGDSMFSESIYSITTDSRKVKQGDLFIAIKGEHFDGNHFVDMALDNGAVAVLSSISHKSPRVITVPDTVKALGKLASGYQDMLDIPVISITGSSGKTTTKDMIFYALNSQCNAYRTEGNFNNEIGMPLTILNSDEEHDVMILEMGMSSLGEIEYLCSIAKPNIGVITNIGTAHLEQLGSQEKIFEAKMEITSFMHEKDILLVNGEDKFLRNLDKDVYQPMIKTFGFSNSCDYFCKNYDYREDSTDICAMIDGLEVNYTIPSLGKHNILNSLAALGVASVLQMDLQKAAKSLIDFQPSKLRMQIEKKDGITIINDSYNANPDSVKSVLSILAEKNNVRRIAILGDMLELGRDSDKYHRQIGECAAHSCDILIGIGMFSDYMREGALEHGMDEVFCYSFRTQEESVTTIKDIMRVGDVVLLKGSRGMAMEKLIDLIF